MRRPSPALVVACVALLVSLGSTSYATVVNVPRASVGTPQLKRNAVKASKLAPNAVRTGHVLNGTLLREDFKPGQIPEGPKGDRGERGPAGPAGVSGYEIVTASTIVPANGEAMASARCPNGKKVTGGTASVGALPAGVFLYTVLTGTETYNVIAINTTAAPQGVNAVAICANVPE